MKLILYEALGQGGVCQYTYRLAESLSADGIDVTVFTAESYELKHLERRFRFTAIGGGSRLRRLVHRIKKSLNRDCIKKSPITVPQKNSDGKNTNGVLAKGSFLKRWRRRLTEIVPFLLRRPDIIHFQWLRNPAEDYYTIKVLKSLRFKIVYTAHNLLPHDSQSPNDHEVFRKIYQLVDRIIVHAENNRAEIIRNFKIDPSKVTVIPHGSYDSFNLQRAVQKEAARKRLGISNHKKVLLFFGLIRKYKGLEYLIEAFHGVREQVDNVMLLIAGKVHGTEEEVKYYTDLLAKESQDRDVLFVDGYIPFEDINYYFAAADIVVLPYLKTYQSGVLLAAYAAGRPVVSTDTGGLREIIEPDKSGLVVPPADVMSLAGAIISIVKSPKQIDKMGQYAKHLSKTKFSWESVALKTIDSYRSLLVTN